MAKQRALEAIAECEAKVVKRLTALTSNEVSDSKREREREMQEDRKQDTA